MKSLEEKMGAANDLFNAEEFVDKLLMIYAFFGCDYLSCFYGISHSFAMKVFEESYNERNFQSVDDCLWLNLKVYEKKNVTLKKMFPCTDDGLMNYCWQLEEP